MGLINSDTNFKVLFALRHDQKVKTLLMVFYNFILLNTLYLLKPVRDSLFLEQAGAQNLPYVFILTAVVVIPVSIGYSRISRRMSMGWIVNIVTLFLAMNLFLLWLYIDVNHNALYYSFYIWVSIYSVLITSQFWLFANTIYDPVQAKKVFSFLSLGAIIGAVTGGEFTGMLINVFGVEPTSLLLICSVILIGTIPLVNGILHYSKSTDDFLENDHSAQPAQSVEVQPTSGNPLKEILGNNHLLLITGLIGITVIVTTLIDFQFKTVAEQAFTTEAALTSFMGKFYGRVSLVAFLLQFFVGAYFTKKYGVSGAILILPVALLVSSGGMLLFPGLVAGTMSRGIDQSLKHSIDRTGRELLFIPLGTNLKKRIKVFIDLFVDHGAQGLTGLLLLGLTFGLGFDVREISIVVIGLLLFWIAIAKMVSNSYVDQFRDVIKQQVSSKSEQETDQPTEKSEKTLLRLLKSHNESDIIIALKNLRNTEANIPNEYIAEILEHPNSQVKIHTLKLLRSQQIEGFEDDVLDFIYDSNPDLRMEAIRYIYQFYEDDVMSNLQVGLQHNDVRIRAMAIGMIAEEGGPKEKALLTDEALQEAVAYEGQHSAELHQQVAKFLGVAYKPQRADLIRSLLQHEDSSVVNEAIHSAAQTGDRQFAHYLILYLGDPVHRESAEKALQQFGIHIFGTLYDYMTDPQLSSSIQKYIPWLFSQTIDQGSWQILEISLSKCILPVRHGVIKSMHQIRKQDNSYSSSEEVILRHTQTEIARYSDLLKARKILHRSSFELTDRMWELIEEEVDQSFENIFRLLSLHYNPDDIIRGYRGLTGNDPDLQTNAMEFLENLISWDIRKLLLPILENYGTDQLSKTPFSSRIENTSDVIRFLEDLGQPALKTELEKILQERKSKSITPENKHLNTKNQS